MSFTHPEAFLLFIVVGLFVVAAVYNFRKKRRLLTQFISDKAYRRLGIRSGGEIDFFKTILITLAMIFFVLALAGPQWGEQVENLEIKGIEMIFLLDTSFSMNAEDLKPNRLVVAKQLIKAIADNLDTDYTGLINFAGTGYVQCPLTIDYEAFKLLVEATDISPREEQGTDFSSAFRVALKTLEKTAGEKKVIILITDGEDHEKRWLGYVGELQDKKAIIFTVGIGATGGAPIPIKDDNGNVTGYKKDKQGDIVKTSLDENTLLQIASRTGGQYFRLADISGVDSFVNILKKFERDVLKKKIRMKKVKRFHIPLFIGIILMFIEFLLSEKRLKWRTNNSTN